MHRNKIKVDEARAGLGRLFIGLDNCVNNLNDELGFLNLYKEYRDWDKFMVGILSGDKRVEFYNKWMSVGEIYPEPFTREKKDQRLINNKIALQNIEGLRNVFAHKRKILEDIGGEVSDELDSSNVFRFSRIGRIYLELTGEEFSLIEDNKNYKLLKKLVRASPNYVRTVDLVSITDSNIRSVQTMIGQLRKKFEKHFQGVRGLDVIEGESGRGYRISHKVKIRLIK